MKNEQLMVRLCPRCGLVFSVSDEECEVCSIDLSQPIPSREAEKKSKKISKNNEKLKESIAAEKASGGVEYMDPAIPRTGLHIAEGVAASVVAFGIIVLIVITLCGSPVFEGMMGVDLLTLVLLAMPILNGFSPSTMWSLWHFEARLHYDVKGPIRPSEFSIVGMHIISIVMIVFGIVVFGVHFLPLFIG